LWREPHPLTTTIILVAMLSVKHFFVEFVQRQ
jgi:hypothetical protein